VKFEDCKLVAQHLVRQYPSLKQQRHGEGYEGVQRSLWDHIKYVRRIGRKSEPQPISTTHQSRKKRCYGNDPTKYRPANYEDGETEASQEEKKKFMQEAFKCADKDFSKISEYMKDTFVSQRESIASGETVEDVLREFPFIGKVLIHLFIFMFPGFFCQRL